MERVSPPVEIIPDTTTESSFQEYFTYLKSVFFNPSWIFHRALLQPTAQVLTYGIISAWLSHFLGFVFETVNSLFFNKFLEGFILEVIDPSLFTGLDKDTFLWAAGSVVLAPFLILLRLFSGAALLYIFSNLLVEKKDASRGTFGRFLKIQGVALHTTWLQLIPFFGSPIAFVANIILLVTGLKAELQISGRRATLVVLAPFLFFIFAIFCLVVFGVIMLTQLPLDQILMGPEE